jgi:type II secretory pathway component PulK
MRKQLPLLAGRRGQALAASLWILVVLTVMVGGLTLTTRTESQIAGSFADGVRAAEAAEAGLAHALRVLETAPPEQFVGLEREWLKSEATDETGALHYQVRLIDEAGKLNVNALALKEEDEAHPSPGGVLRTAVQRLLGPEGTDSLLDWRDEDGEVRSFGAEAPFYEGSPQRITPRNAPLEALDELFFIRGISAFPPAAAGEAAAERKSLRDLLTVYSQEDNTDAKGRPRVNLVRATREQLQEHLGDELTENELAAVLRYRTGAHEPGEVEGAGREPVKPVVPPFRGTGELLDVPFLRDRVRRLADRVTASDEAVVSGRINLNTVSPAVLRLLPGMNEKIISDIVTYRESASGPFRSVGDLLDLPSVPNEVYRPLADCFTVRSQAFTVCSEGWAGSSRTRRRAEAVVVLVTTRPAGTPRKADSSGDSGTPALSTATVLDSPAHSPAERRACVVRYRTE